MAGDGGLTMIEGVAEQGVVFENKNGVEPILKGALNDIEMTKEIAVHPTRRKAVCGLGSRGLRNSDFGIIDVQPDARQFGAQCCQAVSSFRQMDDLDAIKIFKQ